MAADLVLNDENIEIQGNLELLNGSNIILSEGGHKNIRLLNSPTGILVNSEENSTVVSPTLVKTKTVMTDDSLVYDALSIGWQDNPGAPRTPTQGNLSVNGSDEKHRIIIDGDRIVVTMPKEISIDLIRDRLSERNFEFNPVIIDPETIIDPAGSTEEASNTQKIDLVALVLELQKEVSELRRELGRLNE